jgi:hypothetical protein
MRTGKQFDTGHVGYRTEVGPASATWRRESGNRAVVMFIDDTSSDAPARRWPDEQIPGFRPGHIAFNPDPYPSIDEARELLPEYSALWDAVESEYRATLAPSQAPDSAYAQHMRFFDVLV